MTQIFNKQHPLVLLAVALIIVYVVLTYFTTKTDNFDPLTKVITDRTPQALQKDTLFSDIIVYENEYDDNGIGRVGLDKCLEYCDGACVEYGVTGIAQCFPSKYNLNKDFTTIMRNEENETDDVDRAGTPFKFPNLR